MKRFLRIGLFAAGVFSCGPDEPRERPPQRFAAISQGLMVCPTSVVEGLDVYQGDGTIDWSQVSGSGRQFAFIKASQGDYNTQSTFAADWMGAKANAMYRSPYHFFDPTIDGVLQAQHFLTVLDGQGGLQPGDLPPLLDLECPTSSSQAQAAANCEYVGNSGWVATPLLQQRVYDWLNTVQSATGRTPIVYSYPSWFGDVGFTDAQLANYTLFIATLSNCASVPAPWTTTVFWQYSFTGTVPGIAGQGSVDLDRFVGTASDLAAFADAGTDAGSSADAGSTIDAGPTPDAGRPPDAGGGDAGRPAPDAGRVKRGCGCDADGRPSAAWTVAVLLLIAVSALKRR